MAYAKKAPKANEAFQQLKSDIATGTPGCAYIFYGKFTNGGRKRLNNA